MSLSRLSSLLIVLVFAAGCDSAGIGGLTHAAVTNSCGPADGPAVAIYLAPAPVETLDLAPPFVRISITESFENLEGRSWTVGGASEAGAWYQRTATDAETATGGVVNIGAVAQDNSIEGWTDLTFPNGRIRQAFQAGFIQTNRTCP